MRCRAELVRRNLRMSLARFALALAEYESDLFKTLASHHGGGRQEIFDPAQVAQRNSLGEGLS